MPRFIEVLCKVLMVLLGLIAASLMILGIWGQILLDREEECASRFRCVSVQDGASRNERLYVYEDTQTGRLYLYTAGFHRAGLSELNAETIPEKDDAD